jgi:hypothetical protein
MSQLVLRFGGGLLVLVFCACVIIALVISAMDLNTVIRAVNILRGIGLL